MDNFKFNFLSRGSLGAYVLIISSFLSQNVAMLWVFFLVTLFLHLLLEHSVEIILNKQTNKQTSYKQLSSCKQAPYSWNGYINLGFSNI